MRHKCCGRPPVLYSPTVEGHVVEGTGYLLELLIFRGWTCELSFLQAYSHVHITSFTVCSRYIAACAPHIQEFLHPPPMRGSYDYLRLTRNNHMPLPTWTYSQLLDDGWDAKVVHAHLALQLLKVVVYVLCTDW